MVVEARPPVDPEASEAPEASEEAPSEWGVYLPSDLYRVVAWLQDSDLAAEAPLLSVLSKAPLQLPAPEPDAAPGRWQALEVPEAVAALDAAAPDGYGALCAPHLPGALLQPHCIDRTDVGVAAAVVRALHCAAASLLFWRRGHADAAPPATAELVSALEQLQVCSALASGDLQLLVSV